MNKRGINEIIASILLVVIVLVLILILWFVYRALTERGASELQGSDACLKTLLDATECRYQYWDQGSFNKTVMAITFRRNAYNGPLTGVQFLIEDDKGLLKSTTDDEKSAFSANATIPNVTESSEFGFEFDTQFVPVEVRLAAIVGSDERICSPLGQSVSCKIAVGNACADFDGNTWVDTHDVIVFFNLFAQGDPLADLDCNTYISTKDVLLLLDAFSQKRNCIPTICQL